MPQVYSISDRAIQIDWAIDHPDAPNATQLATQLATFAQALLEQIEALNWPVCQLVQADRCLTLVFANAPTGPLNLPGMVLQIQAWLNKPKGLLKQSGKPVRAAKHHVIQVSYGGPAGQDLQWLAEQTGLGVQQVIDLHSSAAYTVQFLGFLPGFAYLCGLPKILQIPRRSSPRARVPAGTLAIGARYCAVYPWESPGGWHLLGHVEQKLFDPEVVDDQGHSLFQPGDTVQFVQA